MKTTLKSRILCGTTGTGICPYEPGVESRDVIPNIEQRNIPIRDSGAPLHKPASKDVGCCGVACGTLSREKGNGVWEAFWHEK